MKTMKDMFLKMGHREKLIARFGNAELVEEACGRVKLRGGSKSDRIEALEWISLFMIDVVPIIENDERACTNKLQS